MVYGESSISQFESYTERFFLKYFLPLIAFKQKRTGTFRAVCIEDETGLMANFRIRSQGGSKFFSLGKQRGVKNKVIFLVEPLNAILQHLSQELLSLFLLHFLLI